MLLLIIIPVFLVLTWGCLYPLTDYYVRFIAPDIIKQGKAPGKKICLTFDDGPDPLNTPVLLKILQTAAIPAAFFLVGRKAEKYPELVEAIKAGGHEIAAHTYYHRHAYLMFLKKSLATITRGKTAIEAITGQPLVYFRPPWGALNLFQYLFLKKMRCQVVLWTANARDWDIRTGPDQIRERLKVKTAPGSIIVLHDSGGDPGAPQNMLQALPEIIADFQANGYRFVSLQEICGQKAAIPSKGGSVL
jgi:peptidoglycan/xylan/chitin deacetylase (PgdA/CDA1 family)